VLVVISWFIALHRNLINIAIAEAKDPVMMARAMRLSVEAGRLSYRAGRMGRRKYADPSSPLAGLI
jgi:thiazole synthase